MEVLKLFKSVWGNLNYILEKLYSENKKRVEFTPRTLILDTRLENIAPLFLHD